MDMEPSAYALALARLAELSTPEASERASRSLALALQLLGRGSVPRLAESLGVTSQTVHNWKDPSGPGKLDPNRMLRIAEHYTAHIGPEATVQLFEAFYDPDPQVATRWLLDNYVTAA